MAEQIIMLAAWTIAILLVILTVSACISVLLYHVHKQEFRRLYFEQLSLDHRVAAAKRWFPTLGPKK